MLKDLHWRPGPGLDFVVEAPLLWVDLLIHEGLQPALEILHSVGEFENQSSLLSAGEAGRTFFEVVRDTFFEVFAS